MARHRGDTVTALIERRAEKKHKTTACMTAKEERVYFDGDFMR
jgi:hypothetical protein